MGTMRIDPGAWRVSAMVMTLLWLAVEDKAGLGGVVVNNVFGWELTGLRV